MKHFGTDITFRWFRSVFSLILVFLAAVAITVIIFMNESLYSSVNTYLDRKSETNTATFQKLITVNYYDFYETSYALMREIEDSEKVKIEFFDKSGVNFLSSDGFYTYDTLDIENMASQKVSEKNPETGERQLIYTVPLSDRTGIIIGAIRYTVSTEKVFVRQTVFSVVCILGVAMIAGFVYMSGQYFVQSIVKPVDNITESAQRIAKGDFSIRVEKKYEDEIGKLSDAINNMALELSKIDALKNDFISSISHELRTPLTAIRGWNETIEMCDPDADREMILKGLKIINAETERLSTMVEELLDYTKIQSGRFTISKSRVNIFTLVLDTLDIVRQKAQNAGLTLTCNNPVFEPIVTGDANRLKQVFINILDNSIKHTEKGGKIQVLVLKNDGSFSVVIRDNGNGIKAEDLPYIKERFYKGKTTKPGSGLGLAICNEIVILHGGALEIDSVEGEGTTVAVILPAANSKGTEKTNEQM